MRNEIKAYCQGALGDATYSKMHKTWRFSQRDSRWLEKLKSLFSSIGYRSWVYREGKRRRVYVLETSANFLSSDYLKKSIGTNAEKIAFIRGFFDAEGGVPHTKNVRFYIQFTQKSFEELQLIRKMLEEMGVKCGKIHNPSVKVDPHYWRFFVRAQSYKSYVKMIGSWHPRKTKLLTERVMI